MPSFKAAVREREPDTYLPYLGHGTPDILVLDNGDKLAMIRLGGIAWETADVGAINAKHAQLNVLLRNIASDRLVLSSHVVRTLANPDVYPGRSLPQRLRQIPRRSVSHPAAE